MKYHVDIKAISNTIVEVKAESVEEAMEKAHRMIDNRKVVFQEHAGDCNFDSIEPTGAKPA